MTSARHPHATAVSLAWRLLGRGAPYRTLGLCPHRAPQRLGRCIPHAHDSGFPGALRQSTVFVGQHITRRSGGAHHAGCLCSVLLLPTYLQPLLTSHQGVCGCFACHVALPAEPCTAEVSAPSRGYASLEVHI